jgi:hypothetical protein
MLWSKQGLNETIGVKPVWIRNTSYTIKNMVYEVFRIQMGLIPVNETLIIWGTVIRLTPNLVWNSINLPLSSLSLRHTGPRSQYVLDFCLCIKSWQVVVWSSWGLGSRRLWYERPGRGWPRPRYVNFEHVQSIRSEVVVKKERTCSVGSSWQECTIVLTVVV